MAGEKKDEDIDLENYSTMKYTSFKPRGYFIVRCKNPNQQRQIDGLRQACNPAARLNFLKETGISPRETTVPSTT